MVFLKLMHSQRKCYLQKMENKTNKNIEIVENKKLILYFLIL
jgi:hypothetical protein